MTTVTLVCLPPAGAGPAFFHHWQGHRPDLRVLPVQLPGREKRFAEPECTDVDELLGVIVPELLGQLPDAGRVAVFGHSFGAFLAYETVRALATAAPGLDLVLVPSGANPPGTPRPEQLTGLPDDAFVAALGRVVGYRHPALDEPELRELLLPTLRCDIAMQEARAAAQQQAEPLDVPVLTVRGTRDEMVSARACEAWGALTTGWFRRAEIEGGHMYLVDAWRPLLDRLADELCAVEPADR